MSLRGSKTNADTRDFSEVGVKSRKTGLTVRENVKKDAHNMEDLDDFFKDDEQTFIAAPPMTKPQNGRLDFTGITTSRAGSRKRTPLLSPLPSREQVRSAGSDEGIDHFDDALDEFPPRSGSAEMEIDEETPGRIVMNNFDKHTLDDGHHISRHSHQTPRGQKLFASSDDEADGHLNGVNKTLEERQLELERNTTVRSNTGRRERQRTPTRLETSPLKSLTQLHSPLQPRALPSSRLGASITKAVAATKKGRGMPLASKLPPPQDYSDDYSDDMDGDFDNGRVVDSDSEEEELQIKPHRSAKPKTSRAAKPKTSTTKSPIKKKTVTAKRATARKVAVPKRPVIQRTEEDSEESDDSEDESYGNGSSRRRRGATAASATPSGRLNKFQRTAPRSRQISPARPKEHHIDVATLVEESRASSRPPPETATRRSSRVRIPPLAYWRNERQVYAKTPGEEVPLLRQVVTVDEPPQSVRSRVGSRAPSRAVSKARGRSKSAPRTARASRRPSKTRIHDAIIEEEDEDEDEDDLEEKKADKIRGAEWLKTGFLKIDAYEGHGSEVKSERLVAWAPKTEDFSSTVKNDEDDFKLAILFDKNREFIASGMMLIPPGGKKNMKSTDGTYFVFYCIKGVIQVTLSGNVFVIKKGCSLEVPMGNFYELINMGSKDALLFFVQTKGYEIADWDEDF